MIPCCWSPKKRCFSYAMLGFDHEHVRKMRNQKLPRHNANFFAHVLRIRLSHHIPLHFQEMCDSTCWVFSDFIHHTIRRQSKTHAASSKIASIGATQMMFHALRVALNSLTTGQLDGSIRKVPNIPPAPTPVGVIPQFFTLKNGELTPVVTEPWCWHPDWKVLVLKKLVFLTLPIDSNFKHLKQFAGCAGQSKKTKNTSRDLYDLVCKCACVHVVHLRMC